MLLMFDNQGNADLQMNSISSELKKAVENGTFNSLGAIDTTSITATVAGRFISNTLLLAK